MEAMKPQYEGGRRVSDAVAQFTGIKLYGKLIEIATIINIESGFWYMHGKNQKFSTSDSDLVLLHILSKLYSSAKWIIPFNLYEELFDRTVEQLQFAIAHNCQSSEEVPGFEALQKDFQDFLDKELEKPMYRRSTGEDPPY